MPFDDEFFADLKACRPAAVERLVGEYEGPLFRYFLAIHGNEQLAGEQSADTFGDLIQALPKMRGGPDQLRGFVYAVARNTERRRWRQRWTGTNSIDNANEQETEAAGPEDLAIHNDQLRHTLRAVRQLDSVTRDVFVLAFVEQLPLGEVAQTLEMPIGTVKSRIHRGRQKLKTLLGETEPSA